MRERPLRLAAAVAALAMAVLLVLLQFALTPARAAPTALFLLFTSLWVFGAIMLVAAPTFGAAGTALWGVVSAVGAWRTHGRGGPEDWALVLASLAAGALAAVALWARLRGDEDR